jgi:hypothetical protein
MLGDYQKNMNKPLVVTYIVYHTYPLKKKHLKALGTLGTTKDESFERIIDHVNCF